MQNANSIFCASFISSTVLAGQFHVPAEFCVAQHVELEYAWLPLKLVERHSHVYFRRVTMSGKPTRSSHRARHAMRKELWENALVKEIEAVLHDQDKQAGRMLHVCRDLPSRTNRKAR